MTALLALASAALVGGADFVGGLTSRRAHAVVVAIAAQATGLVLGIPLALVWGWDALEPRDIALSLASGVCIGIGFACFYTAMGAGLISLVAPITAVTGAVVPVTVGLARGERPGTLAVIGIAIALVAIAIVSLAPSAGGERRQVGRSVVLSLGAGVAFGGFYVLFSEISDAAGMWPVSLQRVASVAVLGMLIPASGAHLGAVRGLGRPAIAIATLEVSATVFLLLALQRGPLTIASVLASLYPVTTVILAALVLQERLTALQLAGVALALGSILLVSL